MSSSLSLSGCHALVTGASRNIGQGIALRLAQAGCHLTVTARHESDGLDDTVSKAIEHGVKAHRVAGDLSVASGCSDVLERAKATLGPVRVLVHTVAIRPHQSFDSLKVDDWVAVRSLILDSAMHMTMGVIPDMLSHGGGRIVLFTGLGAYVGSPERAHVSAAKMGLVGLARGLATEFGDKNIRVNVISPGVIDTQRANPQWYKNAPLSSRNNALKRVGTIQEIADTAHYLVSDASGYMTGQTLHVNGGEAYFG